MARTILVTGGCGFIGSHFLRYLLETYPDERVLNLDKLTYAGNPANVRDLQDKFASRYRFVQGDIADAPLVAKIFQEEKPAWVANLAAESHVDRSILDPEAFLNTNIKGTYTLLEAARKAGIERFLHVSTDEVYGVAEEGRAFREEDPLDPRSPYAASKAGGDLFVRAYFETYGLPTMITRGSNCYGPNQYPEKLIPLAVTNVLEGKKIPVYGDGQQVREWTHVIDHARAIDCVLRNGVPGEVYNFGAGEERPNIAIVRDILAVLGKDESWLEHVKDRPGHDRRYRIDASRIRGLGWEPSKRHAEALQETVLWYRENEEWWKPLKTAEKYQSYAKKNYG